MDACLGPEGLLRETFGLADPLHVGGEYGEQVHRQLGMGLLPFGLQPMSLISLDWPPFVSVMGRDLK